MTRPTEIRIDRLVLPASEAGRAEALTNRMLAYVASSRATASRR